MSIPLDLKTALLSLAAPFRDDVAGYSEGYLGRTLTPQQLDILNKLDTPPYRCLVPSANTTGKTFLAAVKCSHFFDTRVPSVTLATAPTKDSVRDLLFKELRRIRPTTHGFFPKDTRLEYGVDHYIHGITAAKADAFQGRHEENLGILFDEATGIDAEFWKRAETMFAGVPGHWWLAPYNPNDVSSYVFQIENQEISPSLNEDDDNRGLPWHVVRLSALDHVNILSELQGRPPAVSSAIRLKTVLRRLSECKEVTEVEYDDAVDFRFPDDFSPVVGKPKLWHPKTPEFEAQILGRWPIAGNEAIWTPAVFDQCRNRRLSLHPDWGFAAGCDVARFGGDKTTIAVRKGLSLIYLEALSGYNTRQIADRLREVLYAVTGSSDAAREVPVYVDETGGYGAGVIDNADGYIFIGVNSSEQSPDPRFPNVRSWLWWNMRHVADQGACDFSRLDPYEAAALKREFCSPRYHLDAKGRRVVEVKSQVKQRLGGESPDRADAVNLCYYLGA